MQNGKTKNYPFRMFPLMLNMQFSIGNRGDESVYHYYVLIFVIIMMNFAKIHISTALFIDRCAYILHMDTINIMT